MVIRFDDEYLRERTIEGLAHYLMLYCQASKVLIDSKRPHHLNTIKKSLKHSEDILYALKNVDNILVNAKKHFAENARHRIFNMIITENPIIKRFKNGQVFHYFLAVRFWKRKASRYETKIYCGVGKFCRYGRYTHGIIKDGTCITRCPTCGQISYKMWHKNKPEWKCENPNCKSNGFLITDLANS